MAEQEHAVAEVDSSAARHLTQTAHSGTVQAVEAGAEDLLTEYWFLMPASAEELAGWRRRRSSLALAAA